MEALFFKTLFFKIRVYLPARIATLFILALYFLESTTFISYSQDINMPYHWNQNTTYTGYSCGGIFRDPGGTGKYESPERKTHTNSKTNTFYLCNPVPSEPISVFFTFFDLATNKKKNRKLGSYCSVESCDKLTIYDGNVKLGEWKGCSTNKPVGLTFTGTSGCLTFVLWRDQTRKASPCENLKGGGGWDATITTPMSVSAGAISGIQTICKGNTTTFSSNGTPNGTWASSNTTIASVDNSGVITGHNAGTATITYKVTYTCNRSDETTRTVTIVNPPNAGTITGNSDICVNSIVVLSNTGDIGGTWTSNDTNIVKVNNIGILSPQNAGTATISYTLSGTYGCPNSIATQNININAAPTPGAISGLNAICTNTPISLTTSGDTGGTWTSSNTAVATINSSGDITPLTAGTTTITYTAIGSGGCANVPTTHTLTLTDPPSPGTIGGLNAICTNTPTSLTTSGDTGGTWTSSNTAVANVNSNGDITPQTAGTTTITYTAIGSGGCANVPTTHTLTLTAPPNPGTISGASAICSNTPTSLTTSGDTGGTWTSSNTAVATINNNGDITPQTAGTTTITYTAIGSGGCANVPTTHTLTLTDPPNPGTIGGLNAICTNTSTSLTTSGDTGGTWTSSNTAVANVNSNGDITPLTAGTTTITYTAIGSGGCANVPTTHTLTLTAPPSPGTIGGASAICSNTPTVLTASGDSGGIWSSNNTLIADVNSSGNVTPYSDGTVTITYTALGSGGCANVSTSYNLTVWEIPNTGTLTGDLIGCLNESGTLYTDGTQGGTWTSSNPNITFIDENGEMTKYQAGTITASYSIRMYKCFYRICYYSSHSQYNNLWNNRRVLWRTNATICSRQRRNMEQR